MIACDARRSKEFLSSKKTKLALRARDVCKALCFLYDNYERHEKGDLNACTHSAISTKEESFLSCH